MRKHYKQIQVRACELEEGDVVLCNIVGNVAEQTPEKGRGSWREVSAVAPVFNSATEVWVSLVGGGQTQIGRVTLVTIQEPVEPPVKPPWPLNR